MAQSHHRGQNEAAASEVATDQQVSFLSSRTANEELDALHSDMLTVRYRRRVGDFFARLARRPQLVEEDELDDLVDEGAATGAFDLDAGLDLLRTDVIARGRRPYDEHESYLVIQVAARIGPDDVEQAARRAGVLRTLRPVLPVVAGLWVTPEARQLAATAGVWLVLDGSTIAPDAELPDVP